MYLYIQVRSLISDIMIYRFMQTYIVGVCVHTYTGEHWIINILEGCLLAVVQLPFHERSDHPERRCLIVSWFHSGILRN